MQFWKNDRLLPQSPSPVEHRKENNPATLCQARAVLGCTHTSFSHLKYHPLGNAGSCVAWPTRHSHSQGRERERVSLCLPSVLNLLAHNSMHSGGIQLLSQSHPRLFTIALGSLLVHPFSTPPWSYLSVSVPFNKIRGQDWSTDTRDKEHTLFDMKWYCILEQAKLTYQDGKSVIAWGQGWGVRIDSKRRLGNFLK